MKLLLSLFIAAATLLSACTQQPQAAAGKPKYLWFDASANYQRFMQRDSIDYYLDKARYAGFNNVVVDVRGVDGEALYPSRVIPHKNDRDWDYLEYFITAAHSRGMKVMVGTTIFTAGSPRLKRGPAYYENSPLKGRTCQLYLPEGMVCNDDYTNDVSTFLIPSMPENQEYALSFIKELTERYDIDGYSLDYCRYPGVASDFSEFSRRDFEKYLGHELENWPEDIYTFPKEGWPLTPGKYYKQWWTYRSKVISDFVAQATQTIKSIKPHVEVSYWAAGWIYGVYGNGQNWASPRHALHRDPYTDVWCEKEYMTTGFADKIDIFMLGAYLNHIFGLDNPDSIEYSIRRAHNLTKGDCTMLSSIYALNHPDNMEDAAYVCLRDSEGLMVFDICQVIQFDLWDDIRRAIERAEPDIIIPQQEN